MINPGAFTAVSRIDVVLSLIALGREGDNAMTYDLNNKPSYELNCSMTKSAPSLHSVFCPAMASCTCETILSLFNVVMPPPLVAGDGP